MKDIDRELEAMAADIAALRRDDYRDTTRTRTTGALLRFAAWAGGHGWPRGGTGGGGKSSGHGDPTSGAIGHYGWPDEHDLEPGNPSGARPPFKPRPGLDATQAHADLTDAITSAALALKKACYLVQQAYPVDAVEDAPDSACGNVACTHVCTGAANDRIVKPKGATVGLCPRCRKHWERHKRHWPTNREGRDVRSTAA